MPVLTLEGACLAFGHHALLDHASLVIETGERIALIGRNGTGKSSLVRVLAGDQVLDDGKLWRQPGLRIASLAQEPGFEPGATVYEAVASGLGELRDALVDYHHLSASVAAQGGEDPAALARLAELQHALESRDGWTQHSRVDAIIDQMALPADRAVAELSGGWRKRVALARAWVGEPQLLLLDEPTNHLDIEAIEQLEEQLIAFRGAILFVTHDRRFMDRVANRVIELDRGRLGDFGRSWSDYEWRKTDQLAREAVENAKADKFLAQEEVWIRKGVEARRTRSVGRVQRLERLRSARAARRERLAGVRMAVDSGESSGELVAELSEVSIRVPGRTLVERFSTRMLRGDRIGLIGVNGAGKSSLLRVLLGEQAPDEGRVRLGTRLQVAYFDQMRAQLDPEATLVDTISPGSDTVEIAGQRKHVISYLGDFLFPPERARAKVKSLSGGERNRLLLARLFARPANLLMLDEPTNDLDVETLELLEELLADYPGTLILVSHDRAFLDNVVTQVIALDGQGGVVENAGGYEDFRRWRESPPGQAFRERQMRTANLGTGRTLTPGPAAATSGEANPPAAARRRDTPAARVKLSYKEQKELDGLPARIETLEQEQGEVAKALADPANWAGDGSAARELGERAERIEGELLAAMERWDLLDSKQRETAGGS